MSYFILGVLLLPSCWMFITVLSIVIKSIRDTYRRLRNAKMKQDYGWYNWIWIVPACLFSEFKNQVWCWYHGISSKVM